MVTGVVIFKYRNIAEFVCFGDMCAEACRAPVMQFVVSLIVLLCFQVELD